MTYLAAYGPPDAYGLGRLGQNICLDQNQNTIDCASPDCTYGDCGGTGAQLTTGPLCLDQNQNQVPCSNPECTYGDCSAPSRAGTVATSAVSTFPQAVAAAAGPSPRVSVPLSASIPGSFGLWFSNSTLVGGLPNWLVLGGGVAAVLLLTGGGGGRRRR